MNESETQAALDRLPHRSPFRFVNEVRVLEPGVRAEGAWNVIGSEAFFAGHFPDEPIVPGVLLGESLAQLAGLVACAGGLKTARLARIDLKFHAPVHPPARVELKASLARSMNGLALCDVEASVDGVPAATGQVVLAQEATR